MARDTPQRPAARQSLRIEPALLTNDGSTARHWAEHDSKFVEDILHADRDRNIRQFVRVVIVIATAIDTEKDLYPESRKWAEVFHRQCPDAQGLSWVSRQDDSARACVLFGDRIAAGALQQKGTSRSLVENVDTYT